jgi:hypothetical protein
MNIQRKDWLLSRRHFLRGVGVTLALPFLDCMRPVRGFAEKAVPRPRRSAFMYLPNGVNTIDFQIAESGAGFKFSKILEPLEKHRALVTPISGLFHPHALGHNHDCQNIWLTGGKMGPTDRNTISLDQLMSRKTAELTRYSSIELSSEGDTLSWTADGIRLPSERNPGVMFRRLFEAPPGGLEQQHRDLLRKGSILDMVLDDARRLDTQLGQADRGRLEQYLTSVREVEIRTERADKWLATPLPNVDAARKAHLDRAVSQQMVGDYFRTMYDLIVLAFQTDMTRVATFSTGGEGRGLKIPEIQISQDRHSLSHHNGNPKRMDELTASDRFNVQQFAYFLDRLAETNDGDGPLIDTTMALYGSGMSYGHSHGLANLPIILAGGAKLGFKHGRHIDLNKAAGFAGYHLDNPREHYRICFSPVNERARLSNLLLTMAQAMDLEVDRFADSTGTLAEVRS